MSGDPGDVKVVKEDGEGNEDLKAYPYLSSLNPAQLKGVFKL
jgi:hypothetical protein